MPNLAPETTPLLDMQWQWQHLQQLNKQAQQAKQRQRKQLRAIAAEHQREAAQVQARQVAAAAAAKAPENIAHALPVRQEDFFQTMRAKAVDYKEDLDTQVAREQVRIMIDEHKFCCVPQRACGQYWR